MEKQLHRLTIRSVNVESQALLQALMQETRLPMAILIEDAITLLWNSYQDEDPM